MAYHLSFTAFGQEVRLFDTNFNQQSSDSTSRNIRLYYLEANPATIKDFRGDTLQMIASIYGIETVEESDAILIYYKKRIFERQLNPAFFKKSIQLINFTSEGKPLNKVTGRNNKLYYEQVWNEEGNKLLANGSGVNSYFDKRNNEQLREIYLDSLLVEKWGIRQEQQDTIYYHYDKAPQPRGGMQSFYQSLLNNLKYPEQAIRAGKSGRVYIKIIIDKDGQLVEFIPLTENGFQLEGSVVRALQRFRPWRPAIFQGEAVKSVVILPVIFK